MTTKTLHCVFRLVAVSALGAVLVSSASARNDEEQTMSLRVQGTEVQAAGSTKRYRPSLYDCLCGSYGKDWNRQLHHPFY